MKAPINGPLVVLSPFGNRVHPVTGAQSFHNGVDLRAAMNTPIYAPIGGRVSWNRHATGGLQIFVQSEDGLRFGFAHCNAVAQDLRQGSFVKEGTIVGYSGQSGRVTGPHIHMTTSIVADGQKEFFNPERIMFLT